MKNLNYIHYSINAKAGLEMTDYYDNPIWMTVKESNKYAKDLQLNYNNEFDNEVLAFYGYLGISDRSLTKSCRKKQEHDCRLYQYNQEHYSLARYGL